MKNLLKLIAVMGIITLSTIILLNAYLMRPNKLFKVEDLPPIGSIQENPNAPYGAIVQLINDKGDFICSAVVFDGLYALTAQHCLDELNFTIRSDQGLDTGVTAVRAGTAGRADFGLIKGDFSYFHFAKVNFYTNGLTDVGPYIACGFPYGQKTLTCSNFVPVKIEGFAVAGFGMLYPGMSGGPVFNVLTDTVVGVNTAVGEDFVYITPVLGALGAFGIEP